MLAAAGSLYLAWWFACEGLLPGSFNPLPGRLVVVGWFWLALLLSCVSRTVHRYSETLFYLGGMLLLAHFGYLLHHNARDPNWVVFAYLVVFALCASVDSRRWLYGLAAYMTAGAGLLAALDPPLRSAVFLPGLVTVIGLSLLVMLQRLHLLEVLSESTTRFQSLFDASFEGVAVHDRGVIVDANAAFSEMFGYAREELIGRGVEQLSAPELRERVAAYVRADADSRYEAVGLRKDGSRFALEISGKPHQYRGRMLRVAAVRDVSDRERAEQERIVRVQEQAARLSAQQALRQRDEFISIASHELRTPITSLLLNLEVFVSRWHQGQRDVETYAVRVRRGLGRMKRLVDELFEVSRLDHGGFVLSEETVDLASVVQDVSEAMAEDLCRAGCTLAVHAGGQPRGSWDRLRLEQLMENLLRNALTYGAGRPIEVTVGETGERAVLAVRDHGIGIPRELQERIFLRYERGVSVSNYGGLGLGLYIARQIVEAHHGLIRVESEPDAGATFTIELPMQPVMAAAARARA